jgi:hypothetical protein
VNHRVGRGNELHEGTDANVRLAGPGKKTSTVEASYIVSAGAAFNVQMLPQGCKGRAN